MSWPAPARAAGFKVEDREGWHGRPLPPSGRRAIVELGGERHLTVRGPLPEGGSLRARPSGEVTSPATSWAPRSPPGGFGESLAAVGARSNVVALDGEVAELHARRGVRQGLSRRYFEMFIAEQQLIGAVGMSVRD